jgi:two-component system NtrC family sensor kinase
MSTRIAPVEASARAGRAAQHGALNAAKHANCEASMLPLDWGDLGTSDHVVLMYEADVHLVDVVSRFVSTGLAAGEAAIVIVTPPHREQLDARLRAHGVDLATAYAQGQYITLDAAETLAQFMVDGWPDAQRFADVVGNIVAGAGSLYAHVRIFGEMVALLWAAGHGDATLQLEALWHDLLKTYAFPLLCAYPMRGFVKGAHGQQFLTICAAHFHVIPAESYTALTSPDERLRTIAQLQQQAHALATEIAERQALEQTLGRSEQELADFFDHAPMALHWVGPDGIILRVNEAELRLLGYTRDEYLGHHIAEFHADQHVIADILRRLQAGEEIQDCEARLIGKDGTIKHVLLNANVLWEQGQFIHTRCFTRDITERKRGEETRERLAAIVDSSDDAIIGHTLEGIITSWNRGAERLYGYSPAEAVGQPLTLLVPSDLSDDLPHLLERLQRGERIDHYETQRLHKDGTRLDVSLTISPIRDSAGWIIGASKIARDITARKQTEAAQHFLAEASTLLASSLDPATQLEQLAHLIVPTLADWCCVDILHDDGLIHRLAVVHADPAKAALAEQLREHYAMLTPDASHTLAQVLRTGQSWFDPAVSAARLQAEARDAAHWTLEQALGFQAEIVVPLLARGRVLGTITCVLGAGRRRYSIADLALAEELARRAALAFDNARLYQEARVAQEALQQAHVVLEQRVAERTAALEHEMAERQQAEAQLRQQQAMLFQHEKLAAMGTMLASVAHELNNPLAVIMMEADLLHEGRQDSAQAEPVKAVIQAAERCMRIVRNFLTLARQHPPERQNVVLNTVIHGAMELLVYGLQVDTITLDWQLAPDLPPLWADPHQLHQVIVNLVTNAHHALREGPPPRRLTLTTRYDPGGPGVVLEVADTGPGIPPALQARLFEPFFTTKPPGVGTGLGLPLCRGIIEEHGGSISVQSQPGQGTVFRVLLPVPVETSPGRDPSSPDISPAVARIATTILIVDDEPGIVSALAHLLRRDGHTVDTAANGQLALAKLHTQAYDLILCDLRMPELDGPGLYQALQQQYPYLLRRVIFLTGDTLSEEARTFLEQTEVPRLSKPFRAAEVRQLVQHVLQKAGA